MKEWDKWETIIVLLVLNLMVVSTYFHVEILQMYENVFVVDNNEDGYH